MLDPSPIFREYVKEKLTAAKISVDIVQGRRDAFTKLISLLPDLVFIDIDQDFPSTMEFLERKRSNPNTSHLPVIAVGPAISTGRVMELTRLGVIKYLERPTVMDTLLKAISSFLSIPLDLDLTPCIIEAHKNKNVIVVETSLGLNLDKIAMLKFHLAELLSNHAITNPKILLIFSNLNLSFVDGVNLEKLFDNIICLPRVDKKEIKVLTLDPFVKPFIDGHTEYSGIQVESTITALLNSLVESTSTGTITELVESKLLSVDKNTIPCCTGMTFNTDLELRKRKIQQSQV